MITGDYHHTALAVAKQAGMLSAHREVIIVDTSRQSQLHTEKSSVSQRTVAETEPSTSHLAEAPPVTPEISRQTSLQLSTQLPEDQNAAVARLLSAHSSDLVSLRARLVNLVRTDEQSAGLRFVSGDSNQEIEQSLALASLAQGRAQCAVTGAGFELLLQQSDLSTLEVIMQSSIVFARMQPHQKGQVMHLVTRRGLHQMTPNGSRYIPVRSMACKSHLSDCAQPNTSKYSGLYANHIWHCVLYLDAINFCCLCRLTTFKSLL